MAISELAGKPAPQALWVNIPGLVSTYYTNEPDPAVPSQQVAFGTSGHRGTPGEGSFNENHVLAITQALCEYRKQQGITGPLFVGKDTHALSEPAERTALQVFAANGVQLRISSGQAYTPTPVISHAILTYNRGRRSGLADGVVITPSHNPPMDGGFKYNPPSGGPAGPEITKVIQDRANQILRDGLKAVQSLSYRAALQSETTQAVDMASAYIHDLSAVLNLEQIAAAGLRHWR